MFDSIMVNCPKCGKENEFQSKSGDCGLDVYTLENCPDDVMIDINRHSPYYCKCGTYFEVDIPSKTPKIVPMTKPKSVHVFALCYNEEVLLPYFYDHYKNKMFVDKITIYDNYSTDRSVEIAKSLGIEVIQYDSKNEIRDDMYLDIKNHCWKKSDCQWVIVCDIDEWLDYSNVDFSKDFQLVESHGYNMLGINTGMGVPSKDYSKTIMFKRASVFEMNYNFGCHQCTPAGTDGINKGFGVLKAAKQRAKLLHHCFISEEYVVARRQMFAKRLSVFNKQKGFGHQYLENTPEAVAKIFEELRANASVVLL